MLHYLHYTSLHCTKSPTYRRPLDLSTCADSSTHNLAYTTVYYNTLQYTTVHYSILHYTTVYYNTLHYTSWHYLQMLSSSGRWLSANRLYCEHNSCVLCIQYRICLHSSVSHYYWGKVLSGCTPLCTQCLVLLLCTGRCTVCPIRHRLGSEGSVVSRNLLSKLIENHRH